VKASPKEDDRKRLDRERERRKELILWVNQIIILLRKLIKRLTSCISTWSRFSLGGVNYFCQSNTSSNVDQSGKRALVAIANEFEELQDLLRNLESLKDLCGEILPAVSCLPPL
jgi:hypothetical protein